MADSKLLFPTSHDLPSSNLCRIADSVLNLFYPDACLVCGLPTSRLRDQGICGECWDRVLRLRISGNFCPSCGLPFRSFESGPGHLCGRCAIELPLFSGARSFGWYSSELSRIIQALKFGGRRDLAKLLAPLLASTFVEWAGRQEVDLIVPVPLHARRKRERGYNQAALLGRFLARTVGLPFCEGALARVRHTQPQVGLSDAERLANLRHAFRCAAPAFVKGARVLLIDDVMTTGSTVASATAALLNGGALRVLVLTLARAVRGNDE